MPRAQLRASPSTVNDLAASSNQSMQSPLLGFSSCKNFIFDSRSSPMICPQHRDISDSTDAVGMVPVNTADRGVWIIMGMFSVKRQYRQSNNVAGCQGKNGHASYTDAQIVSRHTCADAAIISLPTGV